MEDPTAGRKDSCFQGVPIFWGVLLEVSSFWGAGNLHSRGIFILAYYWGDPNKRIVTDCMGVSLPLGTFTKGEPHFLRGSGTFGSILTIWEGEIPWRRSFKFPGHLLSLEGAVL